MNTENSTSTRIEKNGKSFLDFKKDSKTSTFPIAFAEYVKSMGDIYYWPAGGFHVVSQVNIAKDVLDSDNFSADRGGFFISRMPNMDLRLIQDFFGVVSKMMVMSDGADHKNKRKISSMGFEDHILSKFKDKISSSIEKLVSQIESGKKIDFTKIAQDLPCLVLADLFGIEEEKREDFFKWSNNMTAFFGGASSYENEDGRKVNNSASQLRDYFKSAIEKRRTEPKGDYLSILVSFQKQFDLSDDEIVSQAIMMLVAGQVTSTDQINNCLYLLTQSNSDQEIFFNESKKVPQKIQLLIEAYKKIDPAVTFIFRIAKNDMVLHGQEIKAGEPVFISNHAVNSDLQGNQHFAYGYGSHHCLGSKLARMMMTQLFTKLSTKFSTVSLKEEQDAVRDHYSLSFSGFKKLEVIFQ